MIKKFVNYNKLKPQKLIYFTISVIILLILNYSLLINENKIAYSIPLLFISVIAFFNFQKYFINIFILSLGIVQYIYWDYRIQTTTILSLVIIFYFITFKDTELFNNFKFPLFVKVISILLILEIFTSSIFSAYASFQSFMYAIYYLINILIFFVIFRSVKTVERINELISFFIIVINVSAVICMADIIHTGNFRALGFIGYAIMDFSPLVLLFYIFRNYLFGTANLYIYVTSFILFLLTIFHQSRFAWLGFIITLIYGIIISMKYFPEVKLILKKRSSVLILIILLFFGFLFISGYSSLISTRVSEINFEFFQGTPEEGQYVSNSLETRLLIWITAFNVFIKQPFFGVGYFMFPLISDQYNILPAVVFKMYVEGLDAHTTYFNYLVETGIFGFILFVTLVIYMFTISLKSIKLSVCSEQRRLSLILNIYCFFVMSHSIYAGAFTFGLNSYHMWLMYSIVVVNYVIVKKRNEIDRI